MTAPVPRRRIDPDLPVALSPDDRAYLRSVLRPVAERTAADCWNQVEQVSLVHPAHAAAARILIQIECDAPLDPQDCRILVAAASAGCQSSAERAEILLSPRVILGVVARLFDALAAAEGGDAAVADGTEQLSLDRWSA